MASSTRNRLGEGGAPSATGCQAVPSSRIAMKVRRSDRGRATAGISVSVARPEEQEDDEHDQDEGDQERRLHVADRVDNRLRAVVDRRDPHRARELGADHRQLLRMLLATSTAFGPAWRLTATTTVADGTG